MNLFDSLLGIFSPRHRKMQEMRRKTREELDSLLSRRLVEKVLMFPAEFGGTDDPRNRTVLLQRLTPPRLSERSCGSQSRMVKTTCRHDTASPESSLTRSHGSR